MGKRFSVENNIVTNAPIGNAPVAPTTFTPLNFPATFDKFTIALDRDGVLCECLDAVTGPDTFRPIDESFRAVAIMRSKGHKIVILFDQPGVVQRKVTIEQVEDCNRHMLNLLGQAGCTSIDGIWYNTSSRKDDVYAKPNLGLFKHAESNSPGVQIQGGVYVGDSIDDLLMANKSGATPVLVLTGKGHKTAEKLKLPIYRMLAPKVKIFDNLMRFAETL
jgi:D-glycero-D-manno-heptose 1,7-bisphosphate phosphatase